MNRSLLISALGLGAGMLYFLDRTHGETRRRQFLDRMARWRGVGDPAVQHRVRGKVGRWVSRPESIGVTVDHGEVTLAGPILASEAQRLLRALRRTRGVKRLEDRLEIRDEADLPALLAPDLPRQGVLDLLRGTGSPHGRMIAGLVGGAVAAWGLRRRDTQGVRLALAGIGILARAIAARTPATT